MQGVPGIRSCGRGGRESFTELKSRAGQVGGGSEGKKDSPLLGQETESRGTGESVWLGAGS